MKKPSKSFSQTYPYLTYWIEDWGEMETTHGDYGRSRLTLLDEGGTRYEDEGSNSAEEAFQKAENYLRHELFPEIMDEETIDALEEEYKEYGLE